MKAAMELHVKKKRSMMRRMWAASEDKEKEAVDKMLVAIKDSLFDETMRRTMAQLLISITDGNAHMAHCGQKFETRAAATAHKTACDFRIMPCTNDGCEEKFAARNESMHDGRCGYKVLACEQECGQKINRMDMQAHTTGSCGR